MFTSLPRSGRVRAATLLAEIGDARGRFPTDEALAAAAGISPSTRASGRSHYVVFRRGCNHRLRQAVVDFADGSRAANPWAQDVYARARARGHNHAHAVRVLARAWLRIIWRCWTDHTPYQPEPVTRPHRPSRDREPAAHRHRRARTAGLLTRADVVLDSGSRQPPAGGVQAGRRPPEGPRPGHRRGRRHTPRAGNDHHRVTWVVKDLGWSVQV